MVRAIFTVFVTLCLLQARLAFGEAAAADQKCIHHEVHEQVTFLLVDQSDKLTDIAGLKQTLSAVKEMVQPGERLVVGTVTGKMSETRVIVDIVRPAKSMWESVLKTRAREKQYTDCFTKMEEAVLQQQMSSKTSAILETLSFASNLLSADSSKVKRIVLHSDMVQNSDALSFLSGKTVDPQAALLKVEREKLVWNVNGVEIYVGGAGVNVADDRARKIEQFWRGYFEKAGAALKFYGPIFVGV